MLIGQNKVVSLHCRLNVDDEAGEPVEETFGGEPLVFLFGAGQMIPEFERNLDGKKSGDDLAFKIACDDAYGPRDPDALASLPLSIFDLEDKIGKEWVEAGMSVPMSDADGNRLTGLIKEVKEESVLMDFNHHLAGLDLHFSVRINAVREATPDELAHGHVHGAGGVEH